jgi:hypothetical protein
MQVLAENDINKQLEVGFGRYSARLKTTEEFVDELYSSFSFQEPR